LQEKRKKNQEYSQRKFDYDYASINIATAICR